MRLALLAHEVSEVCPAQGEDGSSTEADVNGHAGVSAQLRKPRERPSCDPSAAAGIL